MPCKALTAQSGCRVLQVSKRYCGALVWLIALAALLGAAYLKWPQHSWLAADFQSLLPAANSSPWIEQANNASSTAYERQVVWLVQGKDTTSVRDAIARVRDQLAESGYLDEQFEEQQAARWRALSAALYPYRAGLLADSDRAQLSAEPAAYFTQFQRLLYSPLGSQAVTGLETDPAGLFASFVGNAAPSSIELAYAAADSEALAEDHIEFAATSINPQRLGFDSLAGLYDLYRGLQSELRDKGITLYATGAPLYAAYGVHSAKREMSTIGVASALLLIALLLWTLRSVTAVALTLLCVGSGVGVGFLTTLMVFQEIHILTLVFGATLIGIAADYALHYLAHALLPQWRQERALQVVFKGLLLGMVSSVVAFSALVILPFPGIRQIGLFMASGLLCSFLTVCLLFPALYRRPERGGSLPGFCRRSQWGWAGFKLPMTVLVVGSLLLLALMPGRDDVREFYAPPAELVLAQQALQQHLNSEPDSRYLLLQASDKQGLLQLEEQTLEQLQVLRKRGVVAGFSGISQLIPAASTQRENLALLRLIEARGLFSAHMATLGFDSAAVRASRAQLAAEFEPVELELLSTLELPLGIAGYLGCMEDVCASWLRLAGVESSEALADLAQAQPGLRLIDPVEDVNASLAVYRDAVAVMLLLALLLTLGFLSAVMGVRNALRTLLLPVASCLTTLLILSLWHGSYSIINLMALLLVLGVGLDYAIFRAFTEPAAQAATTLAITLSALTSILAFGMLSFSSTPVISGFGQTIALGLLLAYGLSWVRFGPKESV